MEVAKSHLLHHGRSGFTSWIVIKGFKKLAGFQKCYRIQIFPKIPINANTKYRVSGRIPIQKKVDFNNTATSTIITTTTSDPSLTLFFLLLLLLQYLLLHIHLLDSGHLIVKYSPVITNLLILLFLSAESALLIGGICFSHWRNCIFIGPCLSTHCGYHSCHSFASVQSWWSVWAFLKC